MWNHPPDDGEIRTPNEWCDVFDIDILDPDGWRGKLTQSFDKPMNYDEFVKRMGISTITRRH